MLPIKTNGKKKLELNRTRVAKCQFFTQIKIEDNCSKAIYSTAFTLRCLKRPHPITTVLSQGTGLTHYRITWSIAALLEQRSLLNRSVQTPAASLENIGWFGLESTPTKKWHWTNSEEACCTILVKAWYTQKGYRELPAQTASVRLLLYQRA